MSTLRIKNIFSLILLCGLLLLSCNKEEIEVIWEELSSNSDADLAAVHFTDENTGHVVGGKTWFSGSYLQTQDGGATWTVDNFADKQLFGLHFNNNGVGATVGIDGYLFSSADVPYEEWDFYRLPRWDILRSVCFNGRNEGTLVGGVAFAEGAIMVTNDNFEVIHAATFENQLNAVCYSDDNTIHVAGYGIILKSTDGGSTWIENEVSGDFFQSISFPTATIGYMVGYNGTILKTTDNGTTWKHLRSGDNITVSDKPFLSVHFPDERNGFIVGEKGLCWRSTDGGENWQVIGGLPKFDYQDVFAVEDWVYIVGEDGRMLRFER